MRRIIFIFLLLPCISWSQALNYFTVEEQSLQLFNDFEYKKLMVLGEKAIDEKIDFYDLRVRLGIVYFKQNKFENACIHFNKAIEMNPSDAGVLNYAYVCLLYTAQYNRANELLVKYPAIVSLLKPKSKGIASIELEQGRVFAANGSAMSTDNIRLTNANYAQGNFFTNMNYIRGYVEALSTPSMRWHFGVNLFQSSHNSKIEFFDQNVLETKTSLNYQYNIGLTQTFKRGITAGLAMGLCRQNFPYPYINSSLNPPQPNASIADSTESSSTFTYSAMLAKRMKFVEPILLLNYGNFDLKTRWQMETGITYFPLGRDQLYGYSSLSYINQNATTSYAFNQKIGYTIKNTLTLEANYLRGSLDNYMGSMGFLTLNTFDPLNWSLGLDAGIHYKKITITPGYRFQQRTGTILQEESPNPGSAIQPQVLENSFTYKTQLLFITIKCQF